MQAVSLPPITQPVSIPSDHFSRDTSGRGMAIDDEGRTAPQFRPMRRGRILRPLQRRAVLGDDLDPRHDARRLAPPRLRREKAAVNQDDAVSGVMIR